MHSITNWVLYGLVHMGKPVYIPHWAHMGLLSGPHMGPCGLFRMGPIWANHYTSHTGPICSCYLSPTWVLYGCAHMGLSAWVLYGRVHMGKPVYIPHWAHMGLLSGHHIGPIWACYLGKLYPDIVTDE